MSAELYVVGLTGNIATGKTVVASMLAELGAEVIDADALAHGVMKADLPTWQRVVDEFGPEILQADGQINRSVLGARVFGETQALARLEAIVHPAVIAETERLLQEKRDEPSHTERPRVVVIEAIKLIESGMHERCDELWAVTCLRQQQVSRLTDRRGLSLAEAEQRINAQPPQEEKVAWADVVIDNSGDLARTRAQVHREWQRIQQARKPGTARVQSPRGGVMSSLRRFADEHPFLTMWAVLAVGMVVIFLLTSRDVDLLPTQRLFLALACVGLAGLCSWIVSWE